VTGTPATKSVENWKYLILVGAMVVAMFLAPPVPQRQAYHHFADTRSFGLFPNALNLLSHQCQGWIAIAGPVARFWRGERSVLEFYRSDWSRGSAAVCARAVRIARGAAVACRAISARYTRGSDSIVSLGVYALAKIFEIADRSIFKIGGIISGHSLKHLVAAVFAYWIYRMLKLRSPAATLQS
jgi:hypothetical protein